MFRCEPRASALKEASEAAMKGSEGERANKGKRERESDSARARHTGDAI